MADAVTVGLHSRPSAAQSCCIVTRYQEPPGRLDENKLILFMSVAFRAEAMKPSNRGAVRFAVPKYVDGGTLILGSYLRPAILAV